MTNVMWYIMEHYILAIYAQTDMWCVSFMLGFSALIYGFCFMLLYTCVCMGTLLQSMHVSLRLQCLSELGEHGCI